MDTINNKRRYVIYILSVTILGCIASIIFGQSILAHPGNTSSDGGHYCWTRCEYWGEVYGQRHFHNGGGTEYIQYGPTDYERGESDGETHAKTKNKKYIRSQATYLGKIEGFDDGYANNYKNSTTFDTPVCDEKVEFLNPQTASYKSGFDYGYGNKCYDIYVTTYEKKYNESYKIGANKLKKEKIEEEQKKKEQYEKTKNVILWVAGGIVLIVGTGLMLRNNYSRLK